MRSATIDSNVYVSALVFRGEPLRLLHVAMEGDVDVAISRPILDETLRILREKFQWSEERIQDAESLISRFARFVSPSKTLSVVSADPSDDKIIECAVEAASEFIVSGDKHLLRLGQYGKTAIVRVADFLREIQAGRER